MAWTIYKDLRKTTPRPDAVTVQREIQVRIGQDQARLATDDVVSVVVVGAHVIPQL
ncbi:hypothetical protein AB0H83_25365 [Dactylosporangium sp. NPDC050688]|uniref:hypothetical protein n=1 Tax=Dactylosporangium sp. NPDC050688 TaxID=3157217 RepID=UPI0033E4D78E